MLGQGQSTSKHLRVLQTAQAEQLGYWDSGPPLQLTISMTLVIALGLRFSIHNTREMEKLKRMVISNLKIQRSKWMPTLTYCQEACKLHNPYGE